MLKKPVDHCHCHIGEGHSTAEALGWVQHPARPGEQELESSKVGINRANLEGGKKGTAVDGMYIGIGNAVHARSKERTIALGSDRKENVAHIL